MDIHHSLNPDLMPKFWEILDHTIQIMAQVYSILGIHKVMITTGISRGMPRNTHDLMKDIISSTHPLHTHPLRH